MLFNVGLDHAIVRNEETDKWNVLKWSHTRWVHLDQYDSLTFTSAYDKAMKLDLEMHGGGYFD